MDRSEFRIIGAGDRVQLGVSAGGRRVVLEMRMDRAVNPLALRGEMRSFQCPATL
jgi:type VI protein secretion system component VasK